MIIQTESLTRRYGQRLGVDHLSLCVPEGSLYGFLGPNGAGKTTTIRVMLGFLPASGGRARVFGMDCWEDSARIKQEVGYLPGDLRLYPNMNGHESLRVFGSIRRRDLREPGRELAERFGLDLTVKVRRMSRGMKQKLGLILAMAHRPRLLVLDEPTTSLDPLMQDVLRHELRSLAQAGHTVFFSSHTLTEVEQLCDRVAILREGRLVVEKGMTELRHSSQREVTLRWKSPEDAGQTPPSFLEILHRDDRNWTCRLSGPIDALIAWVSAHPVEDMTICQPDLEGLFRRYYERGTQP